MVEVRISVHDSVLFSHPLNTTSFFFYPRTQRAFYKLWLVDGNAQKETFFY